MPEGARERGGQPRGREGEKEKSPLYLTTVHIRISCTLFRARVTYSRGAVENCWTGEIDIEALRERRRERIRFLASRSDNSCLFFPKCPLL